MIDVEPVIVRELNALVPAPGSARADWRDVERRAGTRAAQIYPHCPQSVSRELVREPLHHR